MKKLTNRILSIVLALTITLGYAGIPIYKMVCTEDGHVTISITHDQATCKHEVKDCCKPIQKTTKSCCDFNSSFLQLEASSLVYDAQQSTGHILQSVAVLFAPLSLHIAATYIPVGIIHAPPLLLRKQSTQSFIQVFRI